MIKEVKKRKKVTDPSNVIEMKNERKNEYTLKVDREHLGNKCKAGDKIIIDPEFVDRLKQAGVI